VAHGVLHVLGYRDDDGACRAEMYQLQQRVLDQLEGWQEDDGGAP
jgi:ssRNA-specific RNase YbeY (16S rRNA maturation enzyme)